MPSRVRVTWRKKGGKKPDNVACVARPTRYGNPFKVGDDGVPDAATAVQLFRSWLDDDDYPAAVMKGHAKKYLKGKDLACYCPLDQSCHADVLLEIANKETDDD